MGGKRYFLPAVLLGAVWSLSGPVQRWLTGPRLLVGGLIALGCLMANLLAIAQAARAGFA